MSRTIPIGRLARGESAGDRPRLDPDTVDAAPDSPARERNDEIRMLAAIWSECHFHPDPQEVLHLDVADPTPFATRQFRLDSGLHELAVWIPGPHPRRATWWPAMDVWVMLRRVPSPGRGDHWPIARPEPATVRSGQILD